MKNINQNDSDFEEIYERSPITLSPNSTAYVISNNDVEEIQERSHSVIKVKQKILRKKNLKE
jgi:hypothetical protein